MQNASCTIRSALLSLSFPILLVKTYKDHPKPEMLGCGFEMQNIYELYFSPYIAGAAGKYDHNLVEERRQNGTGYFIFQ